MEWKPEIAPQAMVTNIIGQMGPARAHSVGTRPWKGEAWNDGPVMRMPRRPSPIVVNST